ncbi:MAG TPA: transcription termination/antitermination NusG family protein [Pyrinomonadaceae bacterium]|nr:transcription termination/antitermination NusG family protein [Pyrinomonadaceae bacterium]
MDNSQTIGKSQWYAIHAHLHQEHRADANLKAWNVETFYPRIKSKRRNEFSGAITYVTKPFFQRYLFGRFPELWLHKVWFTRGVESVVSFGGTPIPIDDEVIEFIRTRVDKDGFVKLDVDLKPGDKVVMRGGMLDSLEGIFEREMNDSERVMVLLKTIKYQGHIIVAKDSIQKVAS